MRTSSNKLINVPYKYYQLIFVVLALVSTWYLLFVANTPIGPIKIGYSIIRGKDANIYSKEVKALDPALLNIDEIMAQEEKFHRLKYQKRVRIIICTTPEEWNINVPTENLNSSGVYLPVNNTVYINHHKISQDGGKDIEFIKHELSHSLIHQNTTLKNSYQIFKHEWVEEGVAYYYGGPHHVSEKEFSNLLLNNQFDLSLFTKIQPRNSAANNSNLNSLLFQFFTKHLIEIYGLTTYQNFLEAYIKQPSETESTIKIVYRKELRDLIQEFENRYRSDRVYMRF